MKLANLQYNFDDLLKVRKSQSKKFFVFPQIEQYSMELHLGLLFFFFTQMSTFPDQLYRELLLA